MPVLFMLNKKGFTIIEVIIATFVLTVGVVGAFSTIQMVLVFTRSVSAQLEATYLAQEGIENVRNSRDSNWLEDRYTMTDWAAGIPAGAWGWEAIDKFERQITITSIPPNKMVVSVQVQWAEGSSTRQVTAETELYDWR